MELEVKDIMETLKEMNPDQIIEVLRKSHSNDLWFDCHLLQGDDFKLLRKEVILKLTGENRPCEDCTCQKIHDNIKSINKLRRTK